MSNTNKQLTKKRTNTLSIRISDTLKQELEQMAEKENTSVTNLVIMAILDYLQANE